MSITHGTPCEHCKSENTLIKQYHEGGPKFLRCLDCKAETNVIAFDPAFRKRSAQTKAALFDKVAAAHDQRGTGHGDGYREAANRVRDFADGLPA